MTEQALDTRESDRRAFFRTAGTAAAAVAGASVIASCGGGGSGGSGSATPTPTPTATATAITALTDVDVLTFALNLEYLEAQYFGLAVGAGLPASQVTGLGAQGVVSGGRTVTFTDPLVAQYAREIAADKAAHVAFLRTTLGASAVAQPPIDLSSTDPNGAFAKLAQTAGLVPAGVPFDPFASDENFLLGAFFFADLGVTAYKGATPLVTSKTFLDGLAGILAARSYHAGLIRTALYRKGVGNALYINASEAISTARDFFDGTGDDDQGLQPIGTASNIVPVDANGLAYSRPANVALNVYFLTQAATAAGGFFPSGLNSNITVSSATA